MTVAKPTENDMLCECERLKRKGVMIFFNGPICQSLVENIGEVMRRRMADEDHAQGVVRRVFAVLVEQMQNIVHYARDEARDAGPETGRRPPAEDDAPPGMAQGQIVVYRRDGGIHISSGNVIAPDQREHLVATIDAINAMTEQELKEHYKRQRRGPGRAESRGGGLGFIEMARRSANPLTYTFKPLDAESVLFCVDVRIDEEVAA